MKIKKGDNVRVISGKDKGKTGKVARAFPRTNQVIIDGVNVQKHHRKMKQGERQGGGIVSVSAPIHVSNVALTEKKVVKKDEKSGDNKDAKK